MNVMVSGIDGAMCYSSVPLSLPVILETLAAATGGACVKSRRVVFFFNI